MINSIDMKKILLFLFIVSLISCNNDEDQIEILSDNLKKRLFVSRGDPDTIGRDSIIEYYENKLITRSEYFLTYTQKTYKRFNTYDYDANMLLTQINYFTDENLTNLYLTTTYFYDENFRVQKIVDVKFKTSNWGSKLYNYGTYYEYKSDTVRKYRVDHLDNDKILEEDLYLIRGNLDTIKNLKTNHIFLFDKQNDRYQKKYLGDPLDVFSWQTDYTYGNEKKPLINNFFGNSLNVFLIKNHPIRYYIEEQTNKYLERVFLHAHRTNENIVFRYIVDAKNRPLEMRRDGSFYSGDVIKYFYK
ncbi:hypothetical protein ACE939_03800 [Aquimarina sp. W85]|uniref:hypothetical protein n=1 Tax=Aquimarina rhodophyticola TaxID=3342246 RepID=UPI00366C9541